MRGLFDSKKAAVLVAGIVLYLRARFEAWRPLGAIPVIGPRDKDE